MNRIALLGGIVLCLTGVIIGAFGAHALDAILRENDRLPVFELANRYQFYHGLGLLLMAVVATHLRINITVSACLMLFGTVIFSGSLYFLSILNLAMLGAVTPVGGILLITGWFEFFRRSLLKNSS